MKLSASVPLCAVLATAASAAQTSCQIEILNVNQAVVATACIPFGGTQYVLQPEHNAGPGLPRGINYHITVNENCGIGLVDQEWAHGDSARKVGLC
ncbi:hypothetical protein C8035_v001039 [Colletotrichum spinosum]|uniref:ToxB-like N-terminal ascomycota domain-containing protein n=1 Tax=Colletotrichum spinosum TaxID=1347390 RepID=A0A4R8QDL3_9PEZI|nr:hypothetical protein C8035_v001039 [Colletotrichum spinosum]